jgi:CheY-like chemotaxis protein
MEHQHIPCCYHPTTVVFVDDDSRLLTSLCFKLGRKYACKPYINPLEALKFFTEDYRAKPFTDRCLLQPEERYSNQRNIRVDVKAIHQEIYNPKRFSEIAVIVVDYAMPGLNGLELCRKIKNHSAIKVILLTGEADEKIAIQAFNNGDINKFIRKDLPSYDDDLSAAIQELQRDYFMDLSETIINTLTKHPDYPATCLADPIFVELFNNLYTKHQLVEFYLLDAIGSFLFLDSSGKSSYLIVKNDEDMEAAIFDAENSDAVVPAPILQALKSKEKMLCLLTDNDFAKNPSEWHHYVHTTNKIKGNETYYYAYIQNSKAYAVETSRALSYKSFLASL